ncbi:MAG: zinc ABC transporter substrate-binding protein [Chromatiales bacterium]
MRKLLALSLLLLIPAMGCAEPLRVFASVVPIQTFVAKIGGQHVDARVMVRPGFNPHIYDPTPQQISALADAALYVRTGVPFEDAWMERIRSTNPGMQILDARQGIELRASVAHDHHDHDTDAAHKDHESHADEHEHADEMDPHVWTSPLLVRQMIAAIRDKLSELAPSHGADFARNHDAFLAELDALDRDLHNMLDPLTQRQFMVFHPAWGYFADTYKLIQVPIEHEGKQPGARALANLISQAKHEQIKVVFVQPQFDKRQARQVAKAIDGVVIAVDPLAGNYIENLRRVGQQFAQALQP